MIKLISFVLCPFVQRAVITLQEKQIDFSIEYIDLEKPPAWFHRLSPLGKVPLLQVDGEVIFESAVIIDYLDEVFEPRLHPSSALHRAQHKAWIEYGSSLLMDQVALCLAKDELEYRNKLAVFQENLLRLADPIESGLFAAAESDFCMLDAAYAPLFMRSSLLGELREELLEIYPEAVAVWAKRLLERPSVAGSVVQDFRSRYLDFFLKQGSWLMQQVN
jgi:glutathione S-transferase